jgi:hypothetical protein
MATHRQHRPTVTDQAAIDAVVADVGVLIVAILLFFAFQR